MKADKPRQLEREWLPDGRVITYPDLTKEEQAVLRVLSGGRGLCISRYALSWAFADARNGDFKRMRSLVHRMAKTPLLRLAVDSTDNLLECELVDAEEMPDEAKRHT